VLRAPLAHDRDDSDTGGRHQHLVAALLLTPVTSVATLFFFVFFPSLNLSSFSRRLF